MGVGLRGDRHHQVGVLPVVPGDAAGHLEDGEPALAHQGAIVDHAVRDHHAVAEIGVRDPSRRSMLAS